MFVQSDLPEPSKARFSSCSNMRALRWLSPGLQRRRDKRGGAAGPSGLRSAHSAVPCTHGAFAVLWRSWLQHNSINICGMFAFKVRKPCLVPFSCTRTNGQIKTITTQRFVGLPSTIPPCPSCRHHCCSRPCVHKYSAAWRVEAASMPYRILQGI